MNKEWLLTGKGEMMLNNNKGNVVNGNGNQNITQIISDKSREIKLLKQQLADKIKIIELLESKIEILTKK